MEALYHFIRESTAGLYYVLYRSPVFFIDCWSFVHLFSGLLLMALAMRLRLRRRWALVAAALLAYEVLEVAFAYVAIRLFLPETFPDQFTDIFIGLAGAGVAVRVGRTRSPAGWTRGWDAIAGRRGEQATGARLLAGGGAADRAVER